MQHHRPVVRRTLTGLLPLAVATLALGVVAPPGIAAPDAKAREYANCTALNRDYPHGVGKPRAHDHTSGTPVRNFKKSLPLYNANKKSDRDGDGIACEKA